MMEIIRHRKKARKHLIDIGVVDGLIYLKGREREKERISIASLSFRSNVTLYVDSSDNSTEWNHSKNLSFANHLGLDKNRSEYRSNRQLFSMIFSIQS